METMRKGYSALTMFTIVDQNRKRLQPLLSLILTNITTFTSTV